jgi:hypothetical protein
MSTMRTTMNNRTRHRTWMYMYIGTFDFHLQKCILSHWVSLREVNDWIIRDNSELCHIDYRFDCECHFVYKCAMTLIEEVIQRLHVINIITLDYVLRRIIILCLRRKEHVEKNNVISCSYLVVASFLLQTYIMKIQFWVPCNSKLKLSNR